MTSWMRLHDALDEALARLVAEFPHADAAFLACLAMHDTEVTAVVEALGLTLEDGPQTRDTPLMDWAAAWAFEHRGHLGIQAGLLALNCCYLRCVRAAAGDDLREVDQYAQQTVRMTPDALTRSALMLFRDLSVGNHRSAARH